MICLGYSHVCFVYDVRLLINMMAILPSIGAAWSRATARETWYACDIEQARRSLWFYGAGVVIYSNLRIHHVHGS